MNKRGQALIEFVLVLPVLLLIIFAFIDFGRIILCKNHLESIMSDVINLHEHSKDINAYLKEDSDYKITYKIERGEQEKITLETSLDLITPGLNRVLTNPYRVFVERSIIYE